MLIFQKNGFLFIDTISLATSVGIVGIFSAALFPSMTGYLERSRDAARMSNLKDISTSLGAYYADTESYPQSVDGCIDSGELTNSYMPRGVPVDPFPGYIHDGCEVAGKYVYRTWTTSVGIPSYALGATLENEVGGNSRIPLGQFSNFNDIERNLQKGSGRYYIILQ